MKDSRTWLILAGVVLTGWLLRELQPVLMPFLVGMLLAYLGDPLVDRLEAAGRSRTSGVLLVFLLFFLLLLALLLVVVPMLTRQSLHLYGLLPQLLDWLQHSAAPWLQVKLGLDAALWDFERVRSLLVSRLGSSDLAGSLLGRLADSGLALFGWLGNLVLIPVVGFYLLRDWDIMVAKLRDLLPRRREGLVVQLAGECHEVIGAFLRGQLLVMLALAVVYACGLMLVGLELGLSIGVLAGLASLVPYMGFIIGIAMALLAALVQSGLDLWLLGGVALVFTAGQLLEGMWLTPNLVGDRIGLHPVAVIFAILVGGQLFGFAGVLLALPVAAVIMVLLRHVHDFYKLSTLYGESGSRQQDSPESP